MSAQGLYQFYWISSIKHNYLEKPILGPKNINTGIIQENHSELIVLTDLQELPPKDSAEIEEELEEDKEEEKVVKDNRDSDVDTSWNILGA